LTEFVEYYNSARSSMVRDHLPPVRDAPDEVQTLQLDEIEVKTFERKAA
jgi:hypothetical protein